MRFTVFTLTLLAAATTNAFAAEAEPTAWLRVQTDVPYDGKAPLYFNFQPDEAVCKKQYGDDWYDACRRPIGSRLRSDGVVMTPAVRGTWRWLSSPPKVGPPRRNTASTSRSSRFRSERNSPPRRSRSEQNPSRFFRRTFASGPTAPSRAQSS